MENITIIGMKELNQKISRMERSLDDISKSLNLIAKVLNKQVPTKRYESDEKEENNDEMS